MNKSLIALKIIPFIVFSIGFSILSHGQKITAGSLSGKVSGSDDEPIPFASVTIEQLRLSTKCDDKGNYVLKNIPPGKHIIIISAIGYQDKVQNININENRTIHFALAASSNNLEKVTVTGKTTAQQLKETGFNVESVETRELQNQSIQINRLLDWTSGVKVRQEAGLGSKYNYSINGMSGNAVTFFIDGIPMAYFGSSYTINNLPVSLIKRIDIFKGVVPVDLGSDALGGAINVVTENKNKNFAEASYSFGSFNTHQTVLNGQYTHPTSNFITRISGFYTYSDNNYKVWGRGVNYADASTGYNAVDFTKENPATRFNDRFRTLNGKVDMGFVNKKWTDQFFVSLLASEQKKGIQTGQTMATVYGKLHYKEVLFMPHLSYQKKNLFANGLNLNLFSGYTKREGTTVDTSMAFYNWKAETTLHEQGGGEISRNGQSSYTMYEDSWINRVNLTYQITKGFTLGFNYLNSITKRHGKDPYLSAIRIPLIAPQNINTQFAGLSLETKQFNENLKLSTFLKWYDFNTTSNELEYFLVNGEYEARAIPIKNKQSNWGGGMAASYKINPFLLTKFSIEQATRLPTPTEALGNGILVVNNPTLKPEQSLNINLGMTWGRIVMGENNGLTLITSIFFRDTKNQILYSIAGRDEGMYQNVGKTLGKGAELEIIYDMNYWFKINTNITYQDIRNNQRLDNGVQNIIYGDRLRNTPYLLGNAGVSANVPDIFRKESKLFIYVHANYLHEFYLTWPSLGSQNKKGIPSQLVFDAGIGYTFPKQHISVALDLSNFTNTQAYDNFLLQKPGRAAFIKLTYKILNN